MSGQRSCNKVSPRYRGWHDAVSLRIGRAKSCYTGWCGCILYMSLPGATTSSLERLGQSFSTSVHHDIGLPYIHLRTVPSTNVFYLIFTLYSPSPAAFGISHNDLSVNRDCLKCYAKRSVTRNSIDLEFFFRILFLQNKILLHETAG